MRDLLRRTIYNRSYILDIFVGLLLVTTIFFLIGQQNQTEQLNNIARDNQELGQQNQELLEQVKSCTLPEGKCFKDNQERTRVTVDNLDKITLFASYCASKSSPTAKVADVRKCVETAITGKEPIVTK